MERPVVDELGGGIWLLLRFSDSVVVVVPALSGDFAVEGNRRFKNSYRHQFVPVLHEVMYQHQTLSHARVGMTTEGVSSHKQLFEYCIVLDTQRDGFRKLCKQMYCFQSLHGYTYLIIYNIF